MIVIRYFKDAVRGRREKKGKEEARKVTGAKDQQKYAQETCRKCHLPILQLHPKF